MERERYIPKQPKRWVKAAVLAGSLLRSSESNPREYAPPATHTESEPEHDPFPLAHERRQILAGEEVTINGETKKRSEWQKSLDNYINAELKRPEKLGPLADRCSGFEQCYYYYGNQLTFREDLLAPATGKSVAELRFTADVIRGSVVQPVGMAMGPDTIVGVVPIGELNVRHFAHTVDKQAVLDAAYDNALLTSEESILEHRLLDRPEQERTALAEALQARIKTKIELDTFQARVREAQKVPAYNKNFLTTLAPQKLAKLTAAAATAHADYQALTTGETRGTLASAE